jgi:hypothetical protein
MGRDGLPVPEFEDALRFPNFSFAEYCAKYDHMNLVTLRKEGWKIEVKMFHLNAKIV